MLRMLLQKLMRAVGSYRLLTFVVIIGLLSGVLQITKHEAPANTLLVGAAVIASLVLLGEIWQRLRAGKYGVNVLAIVAVGLAVWLQQYWIALALVAAQLVSKMLAEAAVTVAERRLYDLQKFTPDQAHIWHKGKTTDVRASSVQPNDKIAMLPSDIVPADAVIFEGEGKFDESPLTGQSASQHKGVSDIVLAGMVNSDQRIVAQALHTYHDSLHARIVRALAAAGDSRSLFLDLADRYSVLFSIVALTVGGVAWILSRQPERLLDVLAVATPFPLMVAPGLALVAGMNQSASEGTVAKTMKVFEMLARFNTFAFNTGSVAVTELLTLTDITALRPFKKAEVLAFAAALMQYAPTAHAAHIVELANAQSIKLPKIKHISTVDGGGLMAHVGDKQLLVGDLELLQAHGAQGSIGVAVNGQLAGYISVKESIVPSALTALQQLRQFGVKNTILFANGSQTTAQKIGKKLSVAEVVAVASPSIKLHAVEVATNRPLAYAGDGLNDMSALLAADIGIVLGAKDNPGAYEAADVLALGNDLDSIVAAVKRAKRALRFAWLGLIAGSGLSLAIAAAYATGKFPIVAGIALQVVIDLVAVLLALQAGRD